MQLPGDSIGISDLLQWRSCPQRFEFGMRRHTEQEAPEATNENNAYGSAIHDAIHLVEVRKLTNEEAITEVWASYAKWLDPDDLDLLKDDLDKYRGDSPAGMELVASEADVKVPLFIDDNGATIFFRFKLDALYRRIDNPGVFFHRDYKSSKWRKSQTEVDSDPQMWAYNWGIFELYPECHTLFQSYEQLRYGNLPTSKNEDQRRQMKAWLIETVKALLKDQVMAPKQEPFCAYCPLVVTCDVTVRSTRYWRGVLGVMAPLTKEGRKTKVAMMDDAMAVEEMIAFLPRMMQTRKHLEHVEKALKDQLEKMPASERERLGWRLAERKTADLPPVAMRLLHEAMGDAFYEAVTVSKTKLEKVAGKDELQLARDLELERVSSTLVLPA